MGKEEPMIRLNADAIGIRRGALAAALAGALCVAAFAASEPAEPPPAPMVTALPALVEEGDITGVDWFRVDRRHWAVRIRAASSLSPSQLRLWLDTDPADAGDPAPGADRRIEGGVLLRTEPGRGARWTEMARTPWIALPTESGETEHWLLLPPMDMADAAPGWAVESVDAASGARRLRRPEEGLARLDPAYAAPLSPSPEAPPPEPLPGPVPPSLSLDFEELFSSYAWAPSAGPEFSFLPLAPVFSAGAATWTLRLRDVESGEEADLRPVREWHDGDLRFRWEGEAMGVTWTVLAERGVDGGLHARGQLAASGDRDRRVQWIWAVELPEGDWSRIEGLDTLRPLADEDGPFAGAPLLMAASAGGAVALLPDPMEPREVRWFTDAGTRRIGMIVDLVLTPRTARFPGRATVACRMRALTSEKGTPPARALWTELHARGDLRRGALPPARAFAAFEERWDAQPWHVDVPWPEGWARTEDTARALLLFHAAVHPGSGAREALLSGFRRADGGWALRIGDALTPYGLRLPVSLNPDRVTSALASWTPAQRMTHQLDLAGGAVTGLWVQVDGGYAAGAADADAAALAAARHPAAPLGAPGAPAIMAAADAADGWALWTARPPEGRPVFAVRGIAPGLHAAWVCADAFVESARALAELDPAARRGRLADVRAWAGPRRVLVEDDLDAADPRRAALDAELLAWGMEGFGPSVDPAQRALAARLAVAGWMPDGPARSLTPGMTVESFGAADRPVRHLTVRSESDEAVMAGIVIAGVTEPVVAVRPLDGEAQWLEPKDGEVRCSVPVPPKGVAVVNWFRPTDAEVERVALAGLSRPSARMASANLDALLGAAQAGWRMEMARPASVLFGIPHAIEVRIRNLGGEPGVVHHLRVRAGRRAEPLLSAPLVMEAGGERACAGVFTVSDDAVELEVEIEAHRGSARHVWSLRFPMEAGPAVALVPERTVLRVAASETVAAARLTNRSPRAVRVAVALEGADSVDRTFDLESGAERRVEIPVGGRSGVARALVWRWSVDDGAVRRVPVEAQFLDPVTGAMMDDAAQVRVSSVEPGFEPRFAVDGDDATGWATAWGDAEPWFEATPARPVRLSGVRLRWPYVRGMAQTPRRIGVEVADAAGAVRIVDAVLTPAGESRVEFPATEVVRLRVRLAPGDGPAEVPDRLWISEIVLP
jgi:hypothetical protein